MFRSIFCNVSSVFVDNNFIKYLIHEQKISQYKLPDSIQNCYLYTILVSKIFPNAEHIVPLYLPRPIFVQIKYYNCFRTEF